MADQRRRLLWYGSTLVAVVVAYTLVYDLGMSVFEARPRTVLESLVVVVETFTTTGYGEDAPWTSPQMQAFMVLMQLTGVFVIFLTLPLFVAPWVEQRLATTLPPSVDLADHVVICELSTRGENLIEELESWERPYVVVESDRDRAGELHERGLTVIYGDPESTETLESAGARRADAVVADAGDDRNASIVLSARELSDDVRVIAFAEEPEMADYLRYAGADEVFSPRQLLGETLARQVTTAVRTELGDTVEIGDDLRLVELPIQPDSELAGRRLADSGIRERTGANVIGLWHRGEFEPRPEPDARLDEDTHLFVAGTEGQLERLKALTLSEARRRARGTVMIAGYGEVGAKVAEVVARTPMQAVVVDIEDQPGVDIVADATDVDTLLEAGIEDADSLVVTLSGDTETVLATLVARELNPDIQIVARADDDDSVGKIYRAGADYVLALATVSGRMVASTVIEGEEVLTPVRQLEIVRTSAPGLVGQSLEGADVRSATGCTIVAIERDGEVITDLAPDLVIEAGDMLVVAGTDDAMHEFTALSQD